MEKAMAILMNEKAFLLKVGQRIREKRIARGLTQIDVAQRLGVVQSLIASYETAARVVSLKRLHIIAEILGCSVEEFLGQPAPKTKKPGPQSKLEKQFERIKLLPRNKQNFIISMLDNALGPEK